MYIYIERESSRHYLLQRIAVAVQRGNTASVLGSSDDFNDDFIILYLIMYAYYMCGLICI